MGSFSLSKRLRSAHGLQQMGDDTVGGHAQRRGHLGPGGIDVRSGPAAVKRAEQQGLLLVRQHQAGSLQRVGADRAVDDLGPAEQVLVE